MGRFTLGFAPTEPVSPVGFASLRFAFHPGDATRANPRLTVKIGATRLSLVGDERIEATVDLSRSDWQVIDIPLAAFGLFPNDSIEVITFAGNLAGTFYLDDIRLVNGGSPGTAVTERADAATPADFSLSPNYPNPFNPETTTRFDLPQSHQIELAIYNLAAQRVATLVQVIERRGHTQCDGTV